MSLQGVWNTRLSETLGLYEANAYVQGTAFALSLIAVALIGERGFGAIPAAIAETPRFYLLGGVLGLVITVTVMLGIRDLSPTVSISIILISQLLVAAIIDALALFGSERVNFGWGKIGGVALMVAGVLLFKR